jgi:hypothetical protein
MLPALPKAMVLRAMLMAMPNAMLKVMLKAILYKQYDKNHATGNARAVIGLPD